MARRLINKKDYAWIMSVRSGSASGKDYYAHLHADLREIYTDNGEVCFGAPIHFCLTLTSQYDSGRLHNGQDDYGYAFRIETELKSGLGAKMASSVLSRLDDWDDCGDFYLFLKAVAKATKINKLIVRRDDTYRIIDVDSDEAAAYTESVKGLLREYLAG